MRTMSRILARSIVTAVAVLLLPLHNALAAQGDSALAAPVLPSEEALRSLQAWSDSAALADSVQLITRLLTANGAPAARATPVAEAIMKYARVHALDPLLVVGIIGVENATLAPGARSSVGARGVMQVMPLWKRYITNCGTDLRQVEVNICFGTRVLRIALDETNSVREALLRYNGCVRAPGCHSYPTSVFSWVGRAMVMARTPAEGVRISSTR